MEIAKTILEQIKTIDFWALGAYGACNYVNIPQSNDYYGGVVFKVNGFNHKGWVSIRLTFSDLYEINFIVEGGKVIKTTEDVYCDQLVNILDWIEKG
jgi:hypothetical protein